MFAKSVRIHEKLLNHLQREADERSIYQPAIMARIVILERLKREDFTENILLDLRIIAENADYLDSFGVPDDRINIRFLEEDLPLINNAVELMPDKQFSQLVNAVLAEHYDK